MTEDEGYQEIHHSIVGVIITAARLLDVWDAVWKGGVSEEGFKLFAKCSQDTMDCYVNMALTMDAILKISLEKGFDPTYEHSGEVSSSDGK